MINDFEIENAITAVLGGKLSYRSDKEFSDVQVEKLVKAITAAIKVYDRQKESEKVNRQQK